jgi:hypothetical protein
MVAFQLELGIRQQLACIAGRRDGLEVPHAECRGNDFREGK